MSTFVNQTNLQVTNEPIKFIEIVDIMSVREHDLHFWMRLDYSQQRKHHTIHNLLVETSYYLVGHMLNYIKDVKCIVPIFISKSLQTWFKFDRYHRWNIKISQINANLFGFVSALFVFDFIEIIGIRFIRMCWRQMQTNEKNIYISIIYQFDIVKIRNFLRILPQIHVKSLNHNYSSYGIHVVFKNTEDIYETIKKSCW